MKIILLLDKEQISRNQKNLENRSKDQIKHCYANLNKREGEIVIK